MTLSGNTQQNGLFILNGLSAYTNQTGPSSWGFYPISSTKVIAVELDDQQLGIFIIEGNNQQQ